MRKYYNQIIDLVDTWAESYQGKYDQIKKFPSDFHGEREPVALGENVFDGAIRVEEGLFQLFPGKSRYFPRVGRRRARLLARRGRRVVRLHLEGDIVAGLARLAGA